MAKKTRTISHIEEMFRDDSIFTAWTSTWGLIVRPWYEADRLKFNFIQKGAQGKGKSFEIYMECNRPYGVSFMEWAYDILNDRRLERTLNEERLAGEKYPKAYKYITGENGEKSIGICNSSKNGFCINANTVKDGEKQYANIPVRFHDLRLFAENFMRSYESRLNELESIRMEAHKENIKKSESVAENKESKTEEPDIVTTDCVLSSEVTTHKNGMKSLSMIDPVGGNVYGTLFVRQEDNFEQIPKEQHIVIKAEKSGDNYLYKAMVKSA